VGLEPPEFCPVCGTPGSDFEPYEEETASGAPPSHSRWQCLNCNYVHEGPEPPERCPVCGASSDRFQPVETPESRTTGESARIEAVVIGSGIAGVSAAETIRDSSPASSVSLISLEAPLPYYRLNLTRLLAGEINQEALPIHPEQWYARRDIDLVRDAEVKQLSLESKKAILSDGRDIAYDKLILAMGSHPFIPPIPGAGLEGVVSLRTARDADTILARIGEGKECVVIGGGILGLEIAGALSRCARVTLLESHSHLMPRQLNRKAAELLKDHLREIGIHLLENARTREIAGNGSVRQVYMESGESLPAGLVIIATGVRPNTSLARRAGLEVNRGIVVDNYLETSSSGVFAAGDVAEHNGVVYGAWSVSQYQGSIAGLNALGRRSAFGGLPRSNTVKVLGVDLFSIGQFEPLDGSYVVIQDEAEGAFYHFVFLDGRLVGSILLGDATIGPAVKKAIEGRANFSRNLSATWQAADIVRHLKESR
jgi:nitrite reductase (NADH) large subunit